MIMINCFFHLRHHYFLCDSIFTVMVAVKSSINMLIFFLPSFYMYIAYLLFCSIYALKAGAQKIFACEVDKFMCEMSSSILQMNVDPSSISILNKHSKDIHIPSDIPRK